MKLVTLSFCAGASILTCGAATASASAHRTRHVVRVEPYAIPDRPIPYADLDSYLANKENQLNQTAMSVAKSDRGAAELHRPARER